MVEEASKAYKIILSIEKASEDIQALLTGIGEYWFSANNKSIFSQRSALGPFTDLAAITKKSKQKKYGNVYPILVASGALRESLTNPRGKHSIFKFDAARMVGGSGSSYPARVVLGSDLPYVKYHMEGFKHRSGKFVSARPPVSLSAGGLQAFIAKIAKQTGAYFYSKLRAPV